MSRCTGHCCRLFPLPYNPSELKRAYDAWRKGETSWKPDHGRATGILEDIHLIYPMVVHVEYVTDRSPITGEKLPEGYNYYRCKHLVEGIQCSIYEHRPKMCAHYPYGRVCEQPHCTMKEKNECLSSSPPTSSAERSGTIPGP